MKKTVLSTLLSGAIFLGIFNLLFFMIGETPHPISVWISYGFIHASFILSLIIPLATSGRKDFARQSNVSYMFTLPYFVLSFIISVIFMIAAPESEAGIKACWIIQVVLLAIFLIAFLPIYFANAHTNQEVARQGREARFIQNASSKVKMLRDRVYDIEIAKQMDLLYNTIASSPIKSSREVQDLEFRMLSQLADLEDAVDDKNYEEVNKIATKLLRGVQERNRVLGLSSY